MYTRPSETNLQVGDVQITEKAYMSLVCPQVEFASPVWGEHTHTMVHRGEIVQRPVALYVCHWYHKSNIVYTMLEELGWILVEKCRQDT